jgi:two-component system LytT family response regulator
MKINTIIVDDEELGRVNLYCALSMHPDWQILAQCDSVTSAEAALAQHKVDVIFLDIQMPEVSGLELARRLACLPAPPIIIFVTAYDHYALHAFECFALDYLLKPFSNERLAQTLARAAEAVKMQERANYAEALRAYVDERSQATSTYPEQVVLRSAGEIALLPVAQIRFITAAGNYVELHTAHGSKLLRLAMNKFAQTLDPTIFIRIHRSHIVRHAEIASLNSLTDGAAKLTLVCGATLAVSEPYLQKVRECMLTQKLH